jgi:excisionase family DNA binding protein
MTTDPPARSARRWLGVRERQLAPGRRTLTTSEAAALLGVSVPTVRAWADSGRVPCHRTAGGHRRFELEELSDWLRGADAPPPRAVSPAPAQLEFTPCPLLARHLVRRTESIARRLRAHPPRGPSLPLPEPGPTAAMTEAQRYVRPLSRALQTGRLGQLDERARATGLRGITRGQEVDVILRDRRLSEAVMAEAREAVTDGANIEQGALDALRAATEHITAGLVEGMKYRGPLAGPPG